MYIRIDPVTRVIAAIPDKNGNVKPLVLKVIGKKQIAKEIDVSELTVQEKQDFLQLAMKVKDLPLEIENPFYKGK